MKIHQIRESAFASAGPYSEPLQGRTICAHMEDKHFWVVLSVCGQLPMLQSPAQMLHPIT